MSLIEFYPPPPAYGAKPNTEAPQLLFTPQSAPNAYEYYTCTFDDSEGSALDKIREEWLACITRLGDSLSEPIADTIQINAGGAQGYNFYIPRLLSGANNRSQFTEIKFKQASNGSRGNLVVLFSGDPSTPAVMYQAYTWENAPETPAMRIMKCTGPGPADQSTLDTIAQAAVADSVYRLEAEIDPDTGDVDLRVLEDGVEILSYTDPAAGAYVYGLPGWGRRAMTGTFRLKDFRGGILERA